MHTQYTLCPWVRQNSAAFPNINGGNILCSKNIEISESKNKTYIAMRMHCPIWRHLAPARVMRRASGHSQGLGGDAEWRRGEERGNLES